MTKTRRRLNGATCLGLLLVCLFASCATTDYTATYGDSKYQFVVATGSPGELGLLEALAEQFNAMIKNMLRSMIIDFERAFKEC